MGWITRTLGLTLKVPTDGTKNWGTGLLADFVDKLSAHDHTGSGKGTQIGTSAIVNGAVTSAKLASGLAAETGEVKMWPKATPPSGYLLCDGTAVNRTTYAALFAVIGTDWGVGDGSTTFNLPDFRNVSPMGAGATVALAASAGAATHAHTGPSHTHTGPSHTHTGPSHTHTGPSHTHTVPAHYHSSTATGADIATAIETRSSSAPGTGSQVMRSDGTTGSTATDATVPHDNFSGRVGLVTGGVNGDAAMTTGSDGTGNTGASGTGATGADGTGNTGSGGTGATSTDSSLHPVKGIHFIIKT